MSNYRDRLLPIGQVTFHVSVTPGFRLCHNFRVVVLSDEEFDVVYQALEFANSGWTDEDVPTLVMLEAAAWEIARKVRDRSNTPPAQLT